MPTIETNLERIADSLEKISGYVCSPFIKTTREFKSSTVSIETNLERIAGGLEKIATHVCNPKTSFVASDQTFNVKGEFKPSATGHIVTDGYGEQTNDTTSAQPAPAPPSAPAEAPAPAANAAPAAPTPPAPAPPSAPAQATAGEVLSDEEMNALMVAEFKRLGNNRAPIDAAMKELGVTGVSGLDAAKQQELLAAVRAL